MYSFILLSSSSKQRELQHCPAGYFTCKDGPLTCLEEPFVCDCTFDCDDNSDETTDWAACAYLCNSAGGNVSFRGQ